MRRRLWAGAWIAALALVALSVPMAAGVQPSASGLPAGTTVSARVTPAALTVAATGPEQVPAGTAFAVQAHLSNHFSRPLTRAHATLAVVSGPLAGLQVRQPQQRLRTLGPGTTTVSWQVRAGAPGTYQLQVTAEARDPVGGQVAGARSELLTVVVQPN